MPVLPEAAFRGPTRPVAPPFPGFGAGTTAPPRSAGRGAPIFGDPVWFHQGTGLAIPVGSPAGHLPPGWELGEETGTMVRPTFETRFTGGGGGAGGGLEVGEVAGPVLGPIPIPGFNPLFRTPPAGTVPGPPSESGWPTFQVPGTPRIPQRGSVRGRRVIPATPPGPPTELGLDFRNFNPLTETLAREPIPPAPGSFQDLAQRVMSHLPTVPPPTAESVETYRDMALTNPNFVRGEDMHGWEMPPGFRMFQLGREGVAADIGRQVEGTFRREHLPPGFGEGTGTRIFMDFLSGLLEGFTPPEVFQPPTPPRAVFGIPVPGTGGPGRMVPGDISDAPLVRDIGQAMSGAGGGFDISAIADLLGLGGLGLGGLLQGGGGMPMPGGGGWPASPGGQGGSLPTGTPGGWPAAFPGGPPLPGGSGLPGLRRPMGD